LEKLGSRPFFGHIAKNMSLFSIIPLLFGIVHCYFFIEMRVAFGKGLWQIPVLLWFALMVAGRAYMRRLLPGTWTDLAGWVIMI